MMRRARSRSNTIVTATINGERRELPDGTTLATLLDELGVAPVGIAVAVNDSVVRKTTFAAHPLADGDTVEIIRAVAGG
jgi:sulfur carrier protein